MMSVAIVLADESKKSGPIGLVVILVLCIACYFLFKSMSGHMRKVREDFPSADAPASAVTPPAADEVPAEPAPPLDDPSSAAVTAPSAEDDT